MAKSEERTEPFSKHDSDEEVYYTLWNYDKETIKQVLALYHKCRDVLKEDKPIFGYGALIILLNECIRLYDRTPEQKQQLLAAINNDMAGLSCMLDIGSIKNAPTTETMQ